MALERGLDPARRRENFEALWSALDTTYADFTLKSIDWAEVHRRYRVRLDRVADDEGFYRLLFELVNELKDTHSWLQNYRLPPPPEAGDVALDLFGGRVYVVAARPALGIEPGWEVVAVDGRGVAGAMEALRPLLRGMSTGRAYRRQAARHLLAAGQPLPAAVEFRTPAGETRTLTLPRFAGSAVPRPQRPPDIRLTRQRFVHYGRHSSGLGYIRIESFNGHQEIAAEFDRALDEVRDTPGLILDIRDNPGGYGQPHIVGRLLRKRAPAGIGFIKNGPGHNALARHKNYAEPAGPWQYTRPIALLVNDLTGSAADLFACELRSAGRVLTVGSPTHGNLSGVALYIVLPCGLVVRVSNGYLADAKGRPIEGAGNLPDIDVEPTIDDFLAGRDPVLERAVRATLGR
jgi:carboxyl-terminal processing protease